MKLYNMLNPQIMASALLVLLLIIVAGACTDLHDPESPEEEVVEIKADHDHENNEHFFEMSKKELAFGWTTFRFVNGTNSLHFFNMFKLPQEAIEAADQPLMDQLMSALSG